MKPRARKETLRRIKLLKQRALLHALHGDPARCKADLKEIDRLLKTLK